MDSREQIIAGLLEHTDKPKTAEDVLREARQAHGSAISFHATHVAAGLAAHPRSSLIRTQWGPTARGDSRELHPADGGDDCLRTDSDTSAHNMDELLLSAASHLPKTITLKPAAPHRFGSLINVALEQIVDQRHLQPAPAPAAPAGPATPASPDVTPPPTVAAAAAINLHRSMAAYAGGSPEADPDAKTHKWSIAPFPTRFFISDGTPPPPQQQQPSTVAHGRGHDEGLARSPDGGPPAVAELGGSWSRGGGDAAVARRNRNRRLSVPTDIAPSMGSPPSLPYGFRTASAATSSDGSPLNAAGGGGGSVAGGAAGGGTRAAKEPARAGEAPGRGRFGALMFRQLLLGGGAAPSKGGGGGGAAEADGESPESQLVVMRSGPSFTSAQQRRPPAAASAAAAGAGAGAAALHGECGAVGSALRPSPLSMPRGADSGAVSPASGGLPGLVYSPRSPAGAPFSNTAAAGSHPHLARCPSPAGAAAQAYAFEGEAARSPSTRVGSLARQSLVGAGAAWVPPPPPPLDPAAAATLLARVMRSEVRQPPPQEWTVDGAAAAAAAAAAARAADGEGGGGPGGGLGSPGLGLHSLGGAHLGSYWYGPGAGPEVRAASWDHAPRLAREGSAVRGGLGSGLGGGGGGGLGGGGGGVGGGGSSGDGAVEAAGGNGAGLLLPRGGSEVDPASAAVPPRRLPMLGSPTGAAAAGAAGAAGAGSTWAAADDAAAGAGAAAGARSRLRPGQRRMSMEADTRALPLARQPQPQWQTYAARPPAAQPPRHPASATPAAAASGPAGPLSAPRSAARAVGP